MKVIAAINEFYDRNGFGEDGGISKKWVWFKFGFISIPLPNLDSRSQNIYLHDINHIVSGYETNWKGESSIAGWEIASGGWGKAYFPWILTLWAMGIGIVFYYKDTLQAFQKGLKMKNSLTGNLSKQEMFSLSINDLITKLQRTNSEINNRSFFFWSIISISAWLLPFLIVVVFLFLLF